ncbi:unnamed protein product [Caenorhabditis bovis]|uniref:Uncharacterized protein n=1 Tax=Caenorhabditis bovis TaxID=2654633 RepID=A0A8S1EI93_9PELO|nr:unnamed protein product [Caenorhabditis bovis]
MAEKVQKMKAMFENIISTLGNLLILDGASKALKNKCKLPRRDLELVLKRMNDATAEILKEDFEKLINITQMEEKLNELELLTKECDELNKEYGIEIGYRPIDPTIDVNMHGKLTMLSLLEPLDEQIAEFEAQLEDVNDELEKRQIVLKELQLVVKSQQNQIQGLNK